MIGTTEPSRFEQLWSIEQTAEYLALSVKTLYGWRCKWRPHGQEPILRCRPSGSLS